MSPLERSEGPRLSGPCLIPAYLLSHHACSPAARSQIDQLRWPLRITSGRPSCRRRSSRRRASSDRLTSTRSSTRCTQRSCARLTRHCLGSRCVASSSLSCQPSTDPCLTAVALLPRLDPRPRRQLFRPQTFACPVDRDQEPGAQSVIWIIDVCRKRDLTCAPSIASLCASAEPGPVPPPGRVGPQLLGAAVVAGRPV